MKKLKFLTAAIAALTFVSCSKDKSVAPVVYEDAKITLSFVTGSDSKASGEASDAEDQVINNCMAFVFNANSEFDKTDGNSKKYFSTSGDDMQITATTAATEVYIVANLGAENDYNTMLGAITNKADLLAVIKDRIDFGADLKGSVVSIGTPDGVVNWTTNPTTQAKSGTIDVNMAFPLAKINLIVRDIRENNVAPGNVTASNQISSVAENIVILNAGKAIKFFGTAQEKSLQSKFYTGVTGTPAGATYNAMFSSGVSASDIIAWTTNNNSQVTHYFYTAANDGANDNHTILAIETTQVKWNGSGVGSPETVYYPIQFTKNDAKHTLEAGKSYTVTLTLSGDLAGGDEGEGTPDPEEEILSDGTITVNVSSSEWAPVAVGKDFD